MSIVELAIVTLIGAFVGAYSAFKLEAVSRRHEIRANIGAGNRA